MKRWSWVILACVVVAGVVLLLLLRTRNESASTARPLWSRPNDAPAAETSAARSSTDAQLETRPAEPAESRNPVPGVAAIDPTGPRLRWLLRGTISSASRASCVGGEAWIRPDLKVTWVALPNVRAPVGADGKFVADLDLIVYGKNGSASYAQSPIVLTLECPAGMQVQRRFRLDDAQPCTLEDGSPARCIDMQFDVDPAAVVAGTVVDELGNGLQNAAVAILQAPETLKPFAEVARTRTDKSGSFRLLSRPCGPCLVVAAMDDREPAAKRTSIDALGEHPVGRLVLQKGVALYGHVTDKVPFEMYVEAAVEHTTGMRHVQFEGAPASYLAFAGDLPLVEFKWIKCAENGAFEITGLSRASYCLRVIGPQRGGCVVAGMPRPPCFQAPAAGILFATNGARVIFEVFHAGKPLEGAIVKFDEIGALDCPTNYQGASDCLLPPERDVSVRIDHPPLERRVLTVRTPRAGETIVQRVDMQGSERTAALSLRIVNGDPPEPLPYAAVTVRRRTESGEMDYVGGITSYPTDGRWVIEKLPPGKVTVLVEPNGTWNRMRGMMCNETFEIELAAGAVTEHTVTIRPGGLIRIDARDAAGAPAKQRITLRDADGKQVAVGAMVDDGSPHVSLFGDTPGATPFLLVPALPEGDYELDLSGFEYDAKPVTRRIHVIPGTTVDESIVVP